MFERPRGTRDFTPEEMARRRAVEAAFLRVARRFGYGEVATPTFEHAQLFITKSGPGILEELYAFQDKGGRELALRPELTAPIVRFYLSELRSRPQPLKLFYLGTCFRYDEPQFGRYREFYQFGVEILGGSLLQTDAEVIATAVEAVREAGLTGFQVRVGHIGLIRDLLDTDDDRKARILNALDKRRPDALAEELEAAGLGELRKNLWAVVELRGGPEVLERARGLLGEQEGLQYLRELGDILGGYGVDPITYDLGVVRGLDYYTGAVFELHYEPLGAASQICGGGSYTLTDLLGGDPLATTGFGMGFDRVLLALEKAGVKLPEVRLDVYILPVGDHMRDAGYEVLRRVRAAGLSADVDLTGRGPSKNLEHADALGARKAVVVGEREWEDGKVGVKDLETGEQTDVAVEDLVSALGGS
ncbi:MAG: histidine--tRNA ligase [Thermoplasmata archaeon]|nr:histidine--tRNA ligase [Thermoplasmata archaeon]